VDRLVRLDAELARRFGNYASYVTDSDPVLVETHGDDPASEVDRLLDQLAGPRSHVLDLGCGAGFTLCRLAPHVASVWGIDTEPDLLAAARARVETHGLSNAKLVSGSVTDQQAVGQLPDDHFDVVLSRRGPNVTHLLLPKLKARAHVVQELFRDPLGLLGFFGRRSLLGDLGDNPRWLIDEYAWIGLRTVSFKEYYFDFYFVDSDHLARYLSLPTQLCSYPMPAMPYDERRDRAALELYAHYNQTAKGIRVINHRQVGLFRRERVQYAPVAPDVEPVE
jgi:SAM-dependent methyltransferase